MKLAIVGSRGLSPTVEEIDEALAKLVNEHWLPADELVGPFTAHRQVTGFASGAARGADQAGEAWAHHYGIPIKSFPVEPRPGMSRFEFATAAKSRNREIAKYADAALAFWDGTSPGTAHCVTVFVELGKPVRVVRMEVRR